MCSACLSLADNSFNVAGMSVSAKEPENVFTSLIIPSISVLLEESTAIKSWISFIILSILPEYIMESNLLVVECKFSTEA